jgi:hypothetical protein
MERIQRLTCLALAVLVVLPAYFAGWLAGNLRTAFVNGYLNGSSFIEEQLDEQPDWQDSHHP